jgi:hypothetical protein
MFFEYWILLLNKFFYLVYVIKRLSLLSIGYID